MVAADDRLDVGRVVDVADVDAVQDEPSLRERVRMDVPEGRELLGLYRGVPQSARVDAVDLVSPSVISLFKGPLVRVARGDEARLRREVRDTLLHELGHHLGMSEEELPF